MLRASLFAILLASLVALVGCSGGSGTTSGSADRQSSSVLVSVAPSGVGQVWQGTTVQFTATVIGSTNQAVAWSVQEPNGGIISGTGLYTAPSFAGTFHVFATSQVAPQARGGAFVEVPPLTVSIGPGSETLRINGYRDFSGFALAANQNVTWNLQEGPIAGAISNDGHYTAPGTPGSFHLIATSVFNPNVSSTAPITIVPVGFAPLPDMTVARVGHSATLLIDGRVLVAGGTSDATHSAELFSPGSETFAATSGPMLHVRSGHCAALLGSGKVLIAGGGTSSTHLLNTAELFDPATQTFTATGDVNHPRTDATATSLVNGKVLIAGGRDAAGNALSTAELYDPNTGAFTLTANMQSPRAQHTATLLNDGRVLLAGNIGPAADTELFNPGTGTFTPTGSLKQARAHHTATRLQDGRVLVLGGDANGLSLDSAEIYDPATGKFSSAGKINVARSFHSATLLSSGLVLVAGGYSLGFDGDALPFVETMFSAELFDPGIFSSAAASSLEGARAQYVMTRLNNDEILVTGGQSEELELCCHPKPLITPLASAEIYK